MRWANHALKRPPFLFGVWGGGRGDCEFFWNWGVPNVFNMVPSRSQWLFIIFLVGPPGSQCFPNSTTLVSCPKFSSYILLVAQMRSLQWIYFGSAQILINFFSFYFLWWANQRGLSPPQKKKKKKKKNKKNKNFGGPPNKIIWKPK
jgi:hypothetical protein